MGFFYEQRPERLFIGPMTEYPFPEHVHAPAELVVMRRGTAVMTIGGVRYVVNPGDAAIAFPLVPHSFEELSGDARGLIAIFPPDIIPEYAGTFHGLQPEPPFLPASLSGPDVRNAAERLEGLNMDENLPMCVAYLHVLLAGVLHSLTYRPVYDYSELGLGQRIVLYITEHAFEEITQESVSRALGVSPSFLSHFFSERLHTNFRRFINSVRIEHARLLMRDPDLTLTEICGACGFANMRTFRRAFQREMNCLPSDHMAALRRRITENPAPESAARPES